MLTGRQRGEGFPGDGSLFARQQGSERVGLGGLEGPLRVGGGVTVLAATFRKVQKRSEQISAIPLAPLAERSVESQLVEPGGKSLWVAEGLEGVVGLQPDLLTEIFRVIGIANGLANITLQWPRVFTVEIFESLRATLGSCLNRPCDGRRLHVGLSLLDSVAKTSLTCLT